MYRNVWQVAMQLHAEMSPKKYFLRFAVSIDSISLHFATLFAEATWNQNTLSFFFFFFLFSNSSFHPHFDSSDHPNRSSIHHDFPLRRIVTLCSEKRIHFVPLVHFLHYRSIASLTTTKTGLPERFCKPETLVSSAFLLQSLHVKEEI